jgi:hypothetical protein
MAAGERLLFRGARLVVGFPILVVEPINPLMVRQTAMGKMIGRMRDIALRGSLDPL